MVRKCLKMFGTSLTLATKKLVSQNSAPKFSKKFPRGLENIFLLPGVSRHFFFIGRTMVPANIQELLGQACFAPCRSTLRLTRTYHKSCHVVCFAPADSVAPHPPHTPGNPLLCLRCSAPLRRMYLPAGSLSWCAPVPVCHRSAATTCRCVLLFSRA